MTIKNIAIRAISELCQEHKIKSRFAIAAFGWIAYDAVAERFLHELPTITLQDAWSYKDKIPQLPWENLPLSMIPYTIALGATVYALSQKINDLANADQLLKNEKNNRSPEEKRQTAYHEIGHAFAMIKLPNTGHMDYVTIKKHDKVLGHLATKPTNGLLNKEAIINELAMYLAGRVGEQIYTNNDTLYTAGAAKDIRDATLRARQMVSLWGMSEKIGPTHFDMYDPNLKISQRKLEAIEEEVDALISEAKTRATKLLKANKDIIHILVEELLQHETLNAKDVHEIIDQYDTQLSLDLV